MKLHMPWHMSRVQTFFVVFMIFLMVYLIYAIMRLTGAGF